MSYKTIMVHMDTSACANARLSLALRLARKFGAHLEGLFARFEPNPREFYVMGGTAAYYETHHTLRMEQRGAIERLFHAEVSRAQIDGTWVVPDGDPVSAIMQRSRTAELVILGQANPDDPESWLADGYPESVLLGAGGPVLLVPYTGRFESFGERVLIAWNGSREAARAVHDALPFLMRAPHVTIFTDEPSHASCEDLAAMLARHGATSIDVARFDSQAGQSAGDTLLSHAADGAYDLLVMGAYGHARFQELVLGGATRTILSTMTLPVLMSH